MKVVKTASGNKIKMSRKEWEDMGKKAGWMKEASDAFEEAKVKAKALWEEGKRDEALQVMRQFDPSLTADDLEMAINPSAGMTAQDIE